MYALRIGLEMGMVFSRISTIFTKYSVWGLMFVNLLAYAFSGSNPLLPISL